MIPSTPSSGHDPALPADTPVMRLYREHHRLATLAEDRATSSEECDRLCALAHRVADQMAEEPATTMMDLAAKVMVLTSVEGDSGYPWTASVLTDCEVALACSNEG